MFYKEPVHDLRIDCQQYNLNRNVDKSEQVILRHSSLRFFFILDDVLPQLAY
jgi:hypothetical protein